MNITLDIAAAANITFKPVVVNRGRKFRGIAFDVGGKEVATQVARCVTSYSVCLWDPANKRFVYANPDFVEERAIDKDELLEAKRKWIEDQINDTISWCRSISPAGTAEDEILRFATNVLRRKSEALAKIVAELNTVDTRDVVAEVRKTVEWALSLRTRPCWMYGKYCAGGHKYPPKKTISIALRALEKKGIMKLEGFLEAWRIVCNEHNLPLAA